MTFVTPIVDRWGKKPELLMRVAPAFCLYPLLLGLEVGVDM